MQHKLAILDDQPLILFALRKTLESDYNIIFTDKTAQSFLQHVESNRPELVLLDLILPDQPGVEVARTIKKRYPETKILVISVDVRWQQIADLMEVGIDGFLSKSSSEEEIKRAISEVLAGNHYYGRDVTRLVNDVRASFEDGRDVRLTDKEVEILKACCQGKSSKEIGEALQMSPRTVENHKATLFVKLGVVNSTELVVRAIQKGIITI